MNAAVPFWVLSGRRKSPEQRPRPRGPAISAVGPNSLQGCILRKKTPHPTDVQVVEAVELQSNPVPLANCGAGSMGDAQFMHAAHIRLVHGAICLPLLTEFKSSYHHLNQKFPPKVFPLKFSLKTHTMAQTSFSFLWPPEPL